MGAPKVTTVGGGSAKPTADAFNTFLLEQLQGGGFQGMMSGQNNPSPLSFNTQIDDSNPMFAALQNQMNQQRTLDVGNLRERFSGPGARGTPGAFAESSYLAQANPANVLAMGQLASGMRSDNRADQQAQGQYDLGRMGLDQNIMQMLMGAFQQSNSLGTPQAQTIMQPGGFSQFLGGLAGLAPFALAPFTGGASLGLPGMFGGGGGAKPGIGSKDGSSPNGSGPMQNPMGYGAGQFGLGFPMLPR